MYSYHHHGISARVAYFTKHGAVTSKIVLVRTTTTALSLESERALLLWILLSFRERQSAIVMDIIMRLLLRSSHEL